MKNSKIAISVILLILAVVLIWRWMNPAPLDAQALPSSGLGQVLAEETIRVLDGKGRVVVVYLPVESVESQAKIDGFTSTITASRGVTLSETETLVPEDVMQRMGRLSFDRFLGIVKKHADADAIVLFRGVAPFDVGTLKKAADPLPKLIISGLDPRYVHAGFEAGVIHAAVTTREFRTLPTDDPKTPLEWFDRYYEVASPGPPDAP